MKRPLLPVAFAVLALLALAACGSGAPQPMPTLTSTVETPKPTATPTPAPAVETLAFIRDGDIWLINADGTGERRLGLIDVQSFSWVSPDEFDVVAGGEPPRHLLADLEGNVRELSFPGHTGVNAGFKVVQARGSWSRDGRKYVVPSGQEIVVFDRDGREVARVKAGPPLAEPVTGKDQCGVPLFPSGEPDRLVFGPPVFSPDGQRVLVAVNCASASGVYQLFSAVYEVTLDGSINRPLGKSGPAVSPFEGLSTNFRLPETLVAPRFSPDGSQVAQMGAGGFSLCFGTGLAVAEADGANSRPLTLTAIEELFQRQPPPDTFGGITGYDWSPASDAIAASFDLSVCDPATGLQPVVAGLYILNLDGSPEETLVEGPTQAPDWSPSGRFIAYLGEKFFGGGSTEAPTIRLLALSTRQAIDLTQGTAPAWQPQP